MCIDNQDVYPSMTQHAASLALFWTLNVFDTIASHDAFGLIAQKMTAINKRKWGMRVSISPPPACEAGALPMS